MYVWCEFDIDGDVVGFVMYWLECLLFGSQSLWSYLFI